MYSYDRQGSKLRDILLGPILEPLQDAWKSAGEAIRVTLGRPSLTDENSRPFALMEALSTPSIVRQVETNPPYVLIPLSQSVTPETVAASRPFGRLAAELAQAGLSLTARKVVHPSMEKTYVSGPGGCLGGSLAFLNTDLIVYSKPQDIASIQAVSDSYDREKTGTRPPETISCYTWMDNCVSPAQLTRPRLFGLF